MLETSAAYRAAITGDVRRMYARAVVDLISPDIVYGETTSSGESSKSDGKIHDKVFDVPRKWMTCETGRVLLDGSWHMYLEGDVPEGSDGFMSDTVSASDGVTSQWVQLNFSGVSILQAASVYFSGGPTDGVAEDFVFEIRSGGQVYYTQTVTGNKARAVYFEGFTVTYPDAIRVTVSKWSLPGRYMRVVEIVPGIYEQWENDVLVDIDIEQEIDPSCLRLPYGTCTLEMDNQSRRFEPRSKSGVFRSIQERQGIPVWMGPALPDGRVDYKSVGIYYQAADGWQTGDYSPTMTWRLVDIVGLVADRRFVPPSPLPTVLSGWIAAIVAHLGVNFQGRYHVDPDYAQLPVTAAAEDLSDVSCGDVLLWVCMATGTFPRADNETGDLTAEPVWSAGSNITLDNMGNYPVMQANGDLAALYFRLSDGTEVTVSGNTSAASDTVTVRNPFLHTQADALACARRILSFYGGNCYQLRTRGDPASEPGDVDRIQLDLSQAVSARRVQQRLALIGGIMSDLPATMLQPDGVFLYEDYQIITADTTFTVPAGATALRLVLVDCGSDGQPGTAGSFQAAGTAGADGLGGLVWSGTIQVQAGQSFAVHIALTPADHTTFGAYTAANGVRYNGYSDIGNGNVYGRDGVQLPAAGSGDGGAGGAGGVKGNQHTETVRDYTIGGHLPGNTSGVYIEEEVTVVDNYPGSGSPGAAGGSGCAVVYWDKSVSDSDTGG